MTIHCKLGDKNSIVNYKFNEQPEKVLKIKNAPIDVTTIEKPINRFKYEIVTEVKRTWRRQAPPQDVIDIFSYRFLIYSDYFPTSIYYDPTSYRVVPDNGGFYGTENVYLVNNVGTELGGDLGGGGNQSPNYIPGSFVNIFQKEDSVGTRCEAKTNSAAIISVDLANQDRCSINIKYANSTMFAAKGDCPISYTVVCDGDCPPGTIKCFSTNYPGHCCIPCSEIKNEIKAIASQVRSLTNG